MTWLRVEPVTLASGRRSQFKIECDDLTDEEIAAQCALLAKVLPPFGSIAGVPEGGYRVEVALARYMTPGAPLLIVDDVWTTGASMKEFRADYSCPSTGAVLFARGPVPEWVTALWTLNLGLWEA